MAQTYGSHLPMQIRMELDILSQAKRLPGMRSSNIGAETILGRDETIDFEDYLGSECCTPARWPRRGSPPRPLASDIARPSAAPAPDMSETTVDMRAILEKKHGVAPRDSLKGRIGGPTRSAELPRANVAMARDLC